MRILILNWRDPKNPRAGGAEVLTLTMAKRWVAQGHHVTWFSGQFPGGAPEETVDGIRFVRAGGPWTVYWQAFRFYRRAGRGAFDVVLDEVNTMPFFSPWYVRGATVLHFNQLAREVWFYECHLPMAMFGYLWEPLWLSTYRRRPVIAISESGKRDLIHLGFQAERITVIPMGATGIPVLPPVPREPVPTILFVGRLKRSKRVDHAVRALARLRAVPNARLWIVGGGDASYRRALERLVRRLGLQERVIFHGSVSEIDKHRLMQRAHVLVVPSVREGWGLVVSEANHWGTPAAVYPVPGLIDSTQDGVTGVVCRAQSPAALAEALSRLLGDPIWWHALSRNANASARPDLLERAADVALAALSAAAGLLQQRAGERAAIQGARHREAHQV